MTLSQIFEIISTADNLTNKNTLETITVKAFDADVTLGSTNRGHTP